MTSSVVGVPVKVYLSGPMSGLPNENRDAFAAASEKLSSRGFLVFDPAAKEVGTREGNIRMDVEAVLNSDMIAVLPGWQGSAGARLEVQLGNELGLPIVSADDLAPVDLGILGTGGRGDPRFHALLQQIADLHDKKQADYGKDADPFANVRASRFWGIAPWVGALVRLNDKVSRLQSFARKGALANESAEDSMMDIAVYALIALILYREEREKGAD